LTLHGSVNTECGHRLFRGIGWVPSFETSSR
jgi:hypothetical protein